MSSTEEEANIAENLGIDLKEYEFLSPTVFGNMTRTDTGRTCHVIKFEAAPPSPLERMEKEGTRAYERENKKYQAMQRHRMVLDCAAKDVGRFTLDASSLGFHIVQKIDGTPFEAFVEKIAKGSKAKWSLQMLMNREKKVGKSFMIVRFESPEDATVFKIFQR